MARKKVIDPELKEGIAEIVKAMDALIDSDFPATMASMMYKMQQEFIKAGFSSEQAMQLIVAHGVQTLNR